MKKKKLNLAQINVKSFTTSMKEIKGGTGMLVSTECQTQACNSNAPCPTLLGPGEVGLCQPPE